jgi:thioredoxin 1
MSSPDRRSRHVISATSKNWESEILRSLLPVVVDFYANWCGPCQDVGKIIAKLALEYQGRVRFAKLDMDKESEIADTYSIQSIPILIIFKDGRKVARTTGTQSMAAYKRLIRRSI